MSGMRAMGARGRDLTGPKGAPPPPVPPERRAQILRRVGGFFRPYRAAVVVVLLSILFTSVIGTINPLLLKAILDTAIPERDLGLLNLYVGLMILLPIVSGLVSVGQTWLNNIVGQRVMQDLRNTLYAHLQAMPLRFFTETRTGEIQSRLSNDVGGLQSVVTDTASSVASNVLVVVTTAIVMALLDWRLTVLSLALLPFFLWLTWRVGKIRRGISVETQKSLADVTAITEETLSVSGILLSKTFGRQVESVERYRTANAKLAALAIRQSMVGRWFFMIVGTIFAIIPAFIYWLAGYLAVQGDPNAPTPGDIVAFTTLQARLYMPLGQLLNVNVEIAGALALFDRIFEYLDMRPEIVDPPDAVVLDRGRVRGALRFRDVHFRYATPPAEREAAIRAAGAPVAGLGGPWAGDTDAPPAEPDAEAVGDDTPARPPFALEGIDFSVAPGQLVALVGASGSGKTTTTWLVPRLYDVTAGAVEIDGIDVRTIALASLGDIIGFVSQETYLFHATIRENLAYADPGATDAELERAARMAAIHDRIMELPQGYDTLVGERGYKLSGGERQRLAIARVLLKDPPILLLDEATSALDSVSERHVQQALERAMAGRTTIAVAHRLSTVASADQIIVLDHGTIVESGRHEELRAKGGLYAELAAVQFGLHA